MYPENLFKLCYCMGFLFLFCFPIKLLRDYTIYTAALNSAPFMLWFALDVLLLLLPAVLFLAAARILRHKLFSREDSSENSAPENN